MSNTTQFLFSFRKNKMGIILMMISAITVASAQLIWKLYGTSNYFFLGIGLFLYGVSSILMIIAYRYGSLSVLHPILSMNYGFGILLGYLFLKENVSWKNIIGALIITIGVILLSGGDVD